MELEAPYFPPEEPPPSSGPGGFSHLCAPPMELVDYWDWDRIQDNLSGVRTGRLAPWLREAAKTQDPRLLLIRAVVAWFRPITSDLLVDSQALADLAVTGRTDYTAFTVNPPQDDALFTMVRPSLPNQAEQDIRDALKRVLDRIDFSFYLFLCDRTGQLMH